MLAIPLAKDQIQAADQLYKRLEQWALTDKTLDELKEKFPNIDLLSILLKVAAINQLYGTNLYAVMRMAKHIYEILAKDPPHDVKLVEAIATLPNGDRKYYSFASKFAHFFIAPDSIPIYDKHAFDILKLHIGRAHKLTGFANYRKFIQGFDILMSEAGLNCSLREIDRYLWLRGLYRIWNKNPEKAKINREVAAVFKRYSQEEPHVLEALNGKLLSK